MAVPGYARRIARLPAVFEELMAHPAGLSMTDLAARFGVPADELREDLLAFFTADVGLLLGLSRPPVLEFVGADGHEGDPDDAEVVRIVDERPADELGVEYVDASELALVHTSAQALLEIDPDDRELAGAVDVLTETMFGEPLPQGSAGGQPPLEPLRDAVQARHRVRIVYSRSWHAGVTERVIEPYRLVQTRRGWEIDAGPVDDSGAIRTYLLANIRDFVVLDSSFAAPPELPRLLEEQRTTARVRVRIPHHARWAADMYAERVTVAQDDEETVTLDLQLLPPLEQRLGLLLLVSGPDAAVIDPSVLIRTVRAVAGELLAHHRGA